MRALEGRVFGKLTVQLYLDPADYPDVGKCVRYLCACSCGNSYIARRDRLLLKNEGPTVKRQVDCGCGHLDRKLKKEPKYDLTGQVFGKLTVLSWGGFAQQKRQRNSVWLCHCACGVEKLVLEHNLVGGLSASCGCGVRASITTHGVSNTPFSHHLSNLRFLSVKHPNEVVMWPSVQAFKDEMYESFLAAEKEHGKVTLGRIDQKLPYGPGNAVWIPRQQRFSGSNQRIFTLRSGEQVTQTEAIRRSGVSRQQFWNRLHSGLTPEEAMQRKIKRTNQFASKPVNLQQKIQRAIRLARAITG